MYDEYGNPIDETGYGQSFAAFPQTQTYAIPENYGNPKNKIYQLSAAPDEGVRLVGTDGTVFYEGKGDEGARTAAELVQQLGKQFNTGATWLLQKQAPGTDQWQQVSQDTVGKQKTTALNSFLNYALPIAGTVLGGPLGAAAASGLNSALQTKPLTTALKDAALAYGASYVGGKLAPTLGGGSGASNLIGSSGADTLGQVAGNVADTAVEEVVVNGVKYLIPKVASQAIGTGLGVAAGQAIPTEVEGVDVVGKKPQPTQITPPFNLDPADILKTVIPQTLLHNPDILTPDTPTQTPSLTDIAKLLGGLGTAGASAGGASGGTSGNYALNPIFTKALPTQTGSYASLTPRDASAIDYKRYGYGPERSFFTNVPERSPGGPYTVPTQPGTVADPVVGNTASGTGLVTPTAPVRQAKDNFTVFSDTTSPFYGNTAASDWMTQNADQMDPNSGAYAALKGKGTVAAPPVRQAKDTFTVFSDPSSPMYGNTEFSDWMTNNVDQMDPLSGAYLMMKGVIDNPEEAVPYQTGEKQVPQGLARGGKPRADFAVRGKGTGRSDEIDAKLSDGEYVIDAETVALLGDGSSNAGAKKLDRFRVNVRKHKGANLSKGKFSVNAKAPEAYLSGGRT